MKIIFAILMVLVLTALRAPGMDRLNALSQIETRNNDHAIGRQKEVSRFQILPAFWEQARAGSREAGDFKPTDPETARTVADWIMQGRCRTFAARYHRSPTDFEYYILWHRPACLIGRPVPRSLTSAERDRGRRFARLCQAD